MLLLEIFIPSLTTLLLDRQRPGYRLGAGLYPVETTAPSASAAEVGILQYLGLRSYGKMIIESNSILLVSTTFKRVPLCKETYGTFV